MSSTMTDEPPLMWSPVNRRSPSWKPEVIVRMARRVEHLELRFSKGNTIAVAQSPIRIEFWSWGIAVGRDIQLQRQRVGHWSVIRVGMGDNHGPRLQIGDGVDNRPAVRGNHWPRVDDHTIVLTRDDVRVGSWPCEEPRIGSKQTQHPRHGRFIGCDSSTPSSPKNTR